MPDELCRKCGGVLTDLSQCAHCKEVICLICRSCGTKTLEQFHNLCVYHIPRTQTNRVPRNQAGNYPVVIALA